MNITKTSHLVEDEENEVGQQRLDGQVGGSIVDAEDGRQDDVGVVPDALPLKQDSWQKTISPRTTSRCLERSIE